MDGVEKNLLKHLRSRMLIPFRYDYVIKVMCLKMGMTTDAEVLVHDSDKHKDARHVLPGADDCQCCGNPYDSEVHRAICSHDLWASICSSAAQGSMTGILKRVLSSSEAKRMLMPSPKPVDEEKKLVRVVKPKGLKKVSNVQRQVRTRRKVNKKRKEAKVVDEKVH